ncbi:hypothetical protein [Fodinicurvata fenggangensis]|uniref:hypothetical protein n=1 Tax=Fodinicurvata fenggangensis TaxID=1121830 RepID=UPI0004789015|nr:hypothetical protein [Fodinicurvata fenggangensis]
MRILIAILVILLAVPVLAAPGDIHYVKSLQAEVREGPSDVSEVKFVIAIGRKLVEFQREGDYIQAGIDKTGGREGWIRLNQVGPTDPDGLTY